MKTRPDLEHEKKIQFELELLRGQLAKAQNQVKRLMIGMGLLMMGLWLGACQSVRCEGVHTMKHISRELVMKRLMENGYLMDDEDLRSFANERQVYFFLNITTPIMKVLMIILSELQKIVS